MSNSIRGACSRAGIELPEGLEERLALHLEAVLEANRRMNLTAIRELDEAIELHVVDSLLSGDDLAAAPAGRFADLGSGAGYPGIPLALLTGRQADLVESVKKKAGFLEEVVALLRATDQLAVINMRAETLALQTPGAYSAVTARAVSSLPSLVELAAPLLSREGRLIAMKGPVSEGELHAGARVAALTGMAQVDVRVYSLPGRGDRRSCVVYAKVAEPNVVLPRREGLAQRRPLG